MKRTLILSALTLLTGFSACDMDKLPFDNIETSEALQTVSDCKAFRNDLYADFRNTLYNNLLPQEIAADGFNPVVGYSNTFGGQYRWELQASDAASLWSDSYYIIANTNLMIDGMPALIDEANDTDKAAMQEYLGEAYFSRALAYFDLTLKYCKDYEPASAASDWGVPIVLKYAPTADATVYPARASMEETYAQITSDLKKAAELIKTEGEPRSAYANVDVVKALQARVALQMHDWSTAISAAKALIDSNKYPLTSDANAFADMWLKDNNDEAIWQISMTMTEKPSQSGIGSYLTAYIGDEEGTYKPDYIPESGILNAYDKEKDIRFKAYFAKKLLNTGIGEVELYICNKYPGNPDLYTGKSNYYNMQKVFRIAEMYLIATEAYAQSGNAQEASAMLNTLRRARIADWTDINYTGTELMSQIQTERWKELFCEGYRLMDLKRWNQPMRRTPAQNSSYIVLPGAANGENMVKETTDSRFIWPIPQAEIDANPQIKNQQNPGY